MFCPYRASFVAHSFTQGVAIGLYMFKPFQGIFRGYLQPILSIFLYSVTFSSMRSVRFHSVIS